jgi:hypothetical protein
MKKRIRRKSTKKSRLWIQKANLKKGQLHRDLDIPINEIIPLSVLKEASLRGGHIGRRARLALNLRKLHRR